MNETTKFLVNQEKACSACLFLPDYLI